MGKLLSIVTPLHVRTSRDYVGRMMDDKVQCILKAKEYEYDYWDGSPLRLWRLATAAGKSWQRR